MTVYEVCIRNEQNQWLKIPGGMTHERAAKAKAELGNVKLHYPEAFVARVHYIPKRGGGFSRRTFGFLTPLPWMQPTHEEGNAEPPLQRTSRSKRRLESV